MQLNPYLNAVLASAYIWALALFFRFLQTMNKPDNWVDPVGAISLLVFSVALMGFLFFYRPAVLLLDNKRKEAFDYFVKTLATFGILTLIVFGIVSVI